MSVSGSEPRVLAAKRGWRSAASLGLAAVALAGCASQTGQQLSYNHGHEHFAQGKKYGRASPKVVADGQPVPRGGGQYLVGHPYRVAGHTYYPNEDANYSATGMASWYGAAFHGRRTANGEVYDMSSLTAAHPTMPLPSYARVTNLGNGYSIVVRVNDRGPFHGGRVMDVSSRVADVLDFKGEGTARIKVEYIGRAPMEGSDDSQLLASLTTDGSPANLFGYTPPVMVASGGTTQTQAPSETIWSFFGGGRGGHQAQPQPDEAPAATRPEPAPEPPPVQVASRLEPTPPEPVRVAQAEAPATEETPRPELAPSVVRQPKGPVPLPPPRPFDLGSNRSPAVVVATAQLQPQNVVLPPRRPDLHASAEKAIYFVAPPNKRPKAAPSHAFDRLRPAKENPA